MVEGRRLLIQMQSTFLFYELLLHFYSCLVYIRYKSKVKVEVDPKAPFSIATKPRCRGGSYYYPWIAQLSPNHCLLMLNVKQDGIKYYFLSL